MFLVAEFYTFFYIPLKKVPSTIYFVFLKEVLTRCLLHCVYHFNA